MKTRALVTGADGFVGRHLCPELEAIGYTVLTVDLKRGWDARDFFRADDNPPFDLVVHLAANVGGRANIDGAPFDLLADNTELDVGLFQWARRRKPRRIVYFSSSAAYPIELQEIPGHLLTESDLNPRRLNTGTPDATYGFSKLIGERLALEARDAGLDVTVVRPFSGYGTDQDLTYPFPALIEKARRRLDPFPIWGTGLQARDFVHIDDLIRAVITAAHDEIDGPVNIATGRATTFLELARLITEEAGYNPTIETNPDAPMGTIWRQGDPGLLNTFYDATITLEEGITRALDAAPRPA